MLAARPARTVLSLLILIAAHPAAADERDRFHAWLLAGPTFMRSESPEYPAPHPGPGPIVVFGPRPGAARTFSLPVGENPRGAIPKFHAGIALGATPRLALTFDVRRFEVELRPPADPEDEALRRSVLAWGPGARWTMGAGRMRPFVQASFLLITEDIDGFTVDESSTGPGLGLLAGADLHVSDALSIPVAADLLWGRASHDVSSLGLMAGLAVHPATGWSADPVRREVEIAAAQHTTPDVPADRRSRVELGAGSSGTHQFDGEWDERYSLGRASYLRSTKPGLDLSFDARFHRRSRISRSFYGLEWSKSTETVTLAGPGVRFTRKAGWARRFFQANAWLARERETTELTRRQYNTRRTAPGLGLALGLDVQLPGRLTMPLVARYDQVLREGDDNRLITLEGGLAYSWSPTGP